MKKIDFELGFQIKIGFPLAPLLAPPFYKFEKYKLSAFSGKQINVVACLDQFLAQLVPSFAYIPS